MLDQDMNTYGRLTESMKLKSSFLHVLDFKLCLYDRKRGGDQKYGENIYCVTISQDNRFGNVNHEMCC